MEETGKVPGTGEGRENLSIDNLEGISVLFFFLWGHTGGLFILHRAMNQGNDFIQAHLGEKKMS